MASWDLPATAEGLARFCDICVEAYAGFAVVKPQVAFFEAYGSAGFAVLEHTTAALRSVGVLVLADAKRGDIGSTMSAYAQAWTGQGPLAADAVTASPYLGFGSLSPLLDVAAAHGRGVFVLAATSNPEGAGVQSALVEGRTVAQSVVDAASAVNRAAAPEPGSVGVVIGATLAPGRGAVPDVSGLEGPVLVPGVGAQGGVRRRCPGSVEPVVDNYCRRCRGRFCGRVRIRGRFVPPENGCARPSPIWPDAAAATRATRRECPDRT